MCKRSIKSILSKVYCCFKNYNLCFRAGIKYRISFHAFCEHGLFIVLYNTVNKEEIRGL